MACYYCEIIKEGGGDIIALLQPIHLIVKYGTASQWANVEEGMSKGFKEKGTGDGCFEGEGYNF